MGVLQRVANSIWSYVQPSRASQKRSVHSLNDPAQDPPGFSRLRRNALPRTDRPLQWTGNKLTKRPREVNQQRYQSLSTSGSASVVRKKRKAPPSEELNVSRKAKVVKRQHASDKHEVYSQLATYGQTGASQTRIPTVLEKQETPPSQLEDVENEAPKLRSRLAAVPALDIEGQNSLSSLGNTLGDVDTSVMLKTADRYEHTPTRHRHVHHEDGYDRNEALRDHLRTQGWDEDHIRLHIHLSMRGHEAIMPAHFAFAFGSWMPEILFSRNDHDAIINSSCNRMGHASRALEDLLDVGARMRDARYSSGTTSPQLQFRRLVSQYIRWSDRDSGLDLKQAIPLLVLQLGSDTTPITDLKQAAEHKLSKLAARYRDVLRVKRSIEVSANPVPSSSPGTHSTTILAEEPPTLYAFICRDLVLALAGYRPGDERPEAKSVAFFNFGDPAYDAWNAFAIAMTVCHVRDVRMRFAEETGHGAKGNEDEVKDEDDPDA